MPNTVHGPYAAHSWAPGDSANVTRLDNLESQSGVALASFNPDLLTAFVESGITTAKDGTNANQLDIASGHAYVTMTDGTVSRIDVVADNTHTTVTINTTYHLYLQPDGTWYWSTSNSPQANSLHICDVTTDGSGNILTVTDQRPLTTTLLGSGILAPVVAKQSVAATVTPAQTGAPVGGVTFGGAASVQGDASAASAAFDGATGYVALVSGASLPSGNGAFTLEVRFKFASNPGGSSFLIGYGNTNTTKGCVQIFVDTSGKLNVNNGPSTATITSASAASTGTWHSAAVTYDGTTQTLYLDGVSVGTNTPGPLVIASSPAANLGSMAVSLGAYWPGSLAEAAIYSTNLTGARLLAHVTAATAGGYVASVLSDSPLRYYRLGEPVGALYANSSIPSTIQTTASDGSANLGRVASVGGQATAGNFGVPVMVGQGLAVSVTNTSAKTIVSYTTPNDGHNHIIRPTCQFNIGSGNTNFGTITVSLQFTDPFVGGKNIALFRDGDTSGLAGVSLARDTWFTGHQPVLCGPNTTILIAYTNAAAGTINDTVWATLELLS